jgi:hypothetical protein
MPQYSSPDIRKVMESFGFHPTDAEVAQFEGIDVVGGGAAIANYVNTRTQQLQAEANNPLKTYMEQETARRADFEKQSTQLYDQLQQTISAAPKLFGSLTPEQIQAYIAPITQAAKEGSAGLEGDMARRGIAGSSIEANALADAQRKYQENILSQGLTIGMNEQNTAANAIQNRLSQLFGAAGNTTSLLGSAATNLTSQQFGDTQSITQLPLFLQAANQAMIAAKKSGEGATGLGSWLPDVNSALNTTNTLLNLGKSATSTFSGGNSTGIGGANPGLV